MFILNDSFLWLGDLPIVARVVVIALIAVATHVSVVLVRFIASHLLTKNHSPKYRKLRSIGTLATSSVVFTLYFLATGLVLREFGVSLSTYLASASVVGLAIAFGLQGVVQDVVSGLTLIFSDLIDVGDLVSINGQIGVVKAITMRFVELEDALGATVFVPNRTITTIINYPRGYVRCIADITLIGEQAEREQMREKALALMEGIYEQFPGIVIREPSEEGRLTLSTGKEILRLKFRIWPQRGGPIETTFNKELVYELKAINSNYQDWMLAISYEVESKVSQAKGLWSWKTRAR